MAKPMKDKSKEGKQGKNIGYIKPREINEEMRESYIDYAMSVIVSRALPDVRDGLKPVHRRILYAMHEDGLYHNAKFRKSATVVGSTLGRYHPHGDVAVYDSLVRMAQDFSLRYPLVQGQGNFGCFTGDTEIRLCDGRNLSFKDLIKEQKKGKKHWGFTFNQQTRAVEIAEIKKPRLIRKKEKIIEITLDNEEKIKCTLDHRFMLRSGQYKEAEQLTPKDSLMAAYFNIRRIRSHYNYLAVLQPINGHYEFIHRLADEYNYRSKQVKDNSEPFILHHKDFNKFNNSPENIERFTVKQHYKVHLKQAKNLWKERGDEFREKHRESLKKKFSDPVIRKEISERSKKLWQDPEYRAKFPKEHFENMLKELWKKPEIREFHREKLAKQWEDEGFREKHRLGVVASNKRRIEENPNMTKEMAERAKISLHRNWQKPSYKKRVIRSKILGYTYMLSQKYQEVTPDVYEKERTNNGIPRIDNALNYFNDFLEIIEKAQTYNHRIVSVKILGEQEDVYDVSVEPWHNFLLGAGVFVHNSLDSDPPAAQRYTECKLSKIGQEMLGDIHKDTVDFVDNYDATRKEPTVLPSPLPQLLLNGSLGIAVGMATNIPPHNLSEVCDAAIYLIDKPRSTTEELFQFINGPDFPTAGIVYSQKEIIAAYSQGKGPILVQGKAEIVEKKGDTWSIIITEIPYQVNKSTLVAQIAKLIQEKKIKGVKDARDESGREGIRIVLDLKKGAFPQKILNRLYKSTDLQKKFHLNMLALVDGIQPKILSLVEVLNYYLQHRQEVVLRRSKYELARAKEREHILEGLHKCLAKIDQVIATIKKSKNREEAKTNLKKRFKLTDIQAEAILETKLSALARLERKKIEDELKEIKEKIKALTVIIKSPAKIKGVVKKELKEMKDNFGDPRRTKVYVKKAEEICEEDLVAEEEVLITLTQKGYIKRISPSAYKTQKRGGKGITGIKTQDEDFVEHFLLANTLDKLLFFTDSGKVFALSTYEVPQGTRISKGRALVNFLEISPEDKVLAVLALGKKDEQAKIEYLVMATKNGIIKKTALQDFENIRNSGLIAIRLKKGDFLRSVKKTTGKGEIILVTKKAQSIRFKEKEIRPMQRNAAGNKGVRLKKEDELIGMEVVEEEQTKDYLLVITENGYGKRTKLTNYRLQSRGGTGIKTVKLAKRTGDLVKAKILKGDEELIIISQKGQVIRTDAKHISVLGRATQGVRVMKLSDGDKVISLISLQNGNLS